MSLRQLAPFTLLATLLILIPSYRLESDRSSQQFVIWNIGQGQWTTWVQDEECWHFDMGGEWDVSAKVEKLCRRKLNRVFLSHWDWDHIGLLRKMTARNLKICLVATPLGEASESKRRLLREISFCDPETAAKAATNVRELFSIPNLSSPRTLKSNQLSRVFWLKEISVLIPGDSTTQEEKTWGPNIPATTRGLVLGHHGSRTSTSELILEKLPQLRWAVSSARRSRYGHPHPEVVERLAKRKIPLLRTEDWGTLHFRLE